MAVCSCVSPLPAIIFPADGRGGGRLALPDGVKGVLFDCYNTLIDIKTDERTLETFEYVSKWLHYEGVEIDSHTLKYEYRRLCKKRMEKKGERHAEIKVEKVFRDICHMYRIWNLDEKNVGKQAARTFRAASVRKKQAIPESIRLLEHLDDIPKGIVSNGQRIFSEAELMHLGLHHYFDAIVYSSDYGIQKPDPRLYYKGLEKINLRPEETLFIGDSLQNDVLGPRSIGMRSMFIQDAWSIPDRH